MNISKYDTEINNYWQYYKLNISMKLKEIDIFLKCKDKITVHSISRLLNLDTDEIKYIMEKENICKLNQTTFFKIMKKGSSEICLIYQRELERKSPYVYSKEDIAYIYNLDINEVSAACEKLNYSCLTPTLLPALFSCIHFN